MKKLLSMLTVVIALLLTACWNPSVKEVAITAPWDKMNLPTKDNARVFSSDDKGLRVIHKGEPHEVAKMYIDALEKGGWEMTNHQSESWGYINDFRKDGQKIKVYTNEDYDSWIYDASKVNIVKN